jgi:putative phage-type endonuclease
MTHEQWMEARKSSIGSSDIGAIMQLSGYDSPRDIFNKKKGLAPEFEGNDSTEWGTELEDFCTRMFIKKNTDFFPVEAPIGYTIRKDNKIRMHDEYPWATCNLDRLIVGGDLPIILELKTTTSFAMKGWDAAVPTTYYAQVQWQMFVTGYRKAIIWVAVLDTKKFVRLDVEYSEEFAGEMLKAAVLFMSALEAGDPSSLTMTLADYEKYTPQVGSKIEATEEVLSLVAKLAAAKAVKSEAEKTDKLLGAEIKKFIGENEALVQGDRVIALYKTVHKDAYEVAASDYRVLNLQREKKEKKA